MYSYIMNICMVVILVESKRKKNQERVEKKHMKPVQWYLIRWVFWTLLITLCFVMFLMGFYVAEHI